MKIKPGNLKITTATTVVALVVAFLIQLPAWTTEIPSQIPAASDALLKHVRYLASDELMGRGVDAPGIDLARDYIAAEFGRYGLAPGGENGTFFQTLDVLVGVKVNEPTSLSFGEGSPLLLNEEWVPFALSRSADVEGELVFAGYGITAHEYRYDDYAGLDVKGKIVLVLRYEPPPKNEKSPFKKPPRYSSHATFVSKAANARDHGAIGMILVDLHPPRQGEKGLIPIRRTLGQNDAGIVVTQVKREIVEKRLEEAGISLRELKERIDREEKPASVPLPGLKASLRVTLEKITKKTDNVIGLLPGSDPQLKGENIVIGAHYDSVRGSPGANDNASGVAALLEIGHALKAAGLRRTVRLVAFVNEEPPFFKTSEMGSRVYARRAKQRREKIVAMVSLETVGNYSEAEDSQMFPFPPLRFFYPTRANLIAFVANFHSRALLQRSLKAFRANSTFPTEGLVAPEWLIGVDWSDQWSFWRSGYPAIMITDTAPFRYRHYHTVGDTPDKVNYGALSRVLPGLVVMTRTLAGSPPENN